MEKTKFEKNQLSEEQTENVKGGKLIEKGQQELGLGLIESERAEYFIQQQEQEQEERP